MGPLSPSEFKELARQIVAALIYKLMDEKVVEGLVAVWSKQVDRWIGRSVRKLAFYVLLAAIGVGAVKFHVWDLMFR